MISGIVTRCVNAGGVAVWTARQKAQGHLEEMQFYSNLYIFLYFAIAQYVELMTAS